MADDVFWLEDRDSSNRSRPYAETRPGGGITMPDFGALGEPATMNVARAAPVTAVLTARYTTPGIKHPKMRSSAHPGGPKLRAPNTEYKVTGFQGRPARCRSEGASRLPYKAIQTSFLMPDNFCYSPADLTETQDQQQCGSCWAFAIAHMLADRVCIKSGSRTRAALSARHIMECSDYASGSPDTGCGGNDPYTSLLSIQNKPIWVAARDVYPRQYDGANVQHTDCQANSNSIYGVSCREASILTTPIKQLRDAGHLANIENIKKAIYNEGPAYCVIKVYDDFKNYDGLTIYEPSKAALDAYNDETGDRHAVELIGWGKEPQSKATYWVCRNSWGDAWPPKNRTCAGKDFFYIRMGSNVAGIEENVAAAVPMFRNPSYAPKNSNDALNAGFGFFCKLKTAFSDPAVLIKSNEGILVGGIVVLVVAVGMVWVIRHYKISRS